MLCTVFETFIKMNCAAAVTAAMVLPVKYLLEKAGLPRRVLFLLWIVIAFRLICPFSLESQLSFWNIRGIAERETNVAYQTDAQTDALVRADLPAQTDFPESVPTEDVQKNVLTALSAIWLCGIAAVLAYGTVSYIRLRKRLVFAVRHEDKIYLADNIPTAFVFGMFRAKIYIPASTNRTRLGYVIEHERMHIRRLDHISKLAAYVVLAVNWFNPVNWLLFRLFSDDMELACDECVIRKIGIGHRKEYLNSLLSAATGKIEIPYHVCFSESITKRRVKAMLKIKKFSAVMTVIAVICCIALAAAFGTDSETNDTKIVSKYGKELEQLYQSKVSTERDEYIYFGRFAEKYAPMVEDDKQFYDELKNKYHIDSHERNIMIDLSEDEIARLNPNFYYSSKITQAGAKCQEKYSKVDLLDYQNAEILEQEMNNDFFIINVPDGLFVDIEAIYMRGIVIQQLQKAIDKDNSENNRPYVSSFTYGSK